MVFSIKELIFTINISIKFQIYFTKYFNLFFFILTDYIPIYTNNNSELSDIFYIKMLILSKGPGCHDGTQHRFLLNRDLLTD